MPLVYVKAFQTSGGAKCKHKLDVNLGKNWMYTFTFTVFKCIYLPGIVSLSAKLVIIGDPHFKKEYMQNLALHFNSSFCKFTGVGITYLSDAIGKKEKGD